MADIPKVALLIETSRGYGRGILRGIVRYARLHGPWSFYITPGDFEQALPRMRAWGGTGIIARIETAKVAAAICRTGLPVIALDLAPEHRRRGGCLAGVSEIRPDPVAAAELAADHLLARSFTRFAFVGISGRVWSENRQKAFIGRVEREGYECHVYRSPRSKQAQEWSREQRVMARWLSRLPQPIGLFACNDDRGRQVLEACLAAGVAVPDEIAVVGMDNDDLLCDLCDPPLSSVALNTERGGFEAAGLLDRLMRGIDRGLRTITVEPLQVVSRKSSDVLAVNDRMVADALAFIRSHADQPFHVTDLLRVVPISRRSLEQRFRRAVGRSLNEEMRNVHFRRASQLLLETDYPVTKVAELAGFNSASYMGQVFRDRTGKTPARFRLEARGH